MSDCAHCIQALWLSLAPVCRVVSCPVLNCAGMLILYCVEQHVHALYSAVLCFVSQWTVLVAYYTVLYFAVLYCAVLCYTLLPCNYITLSVPTSFSTPCCCWCCSRMSRLTRVEVVTDPCHPCMHNPVRPATMPPSRHLMLTARSNLPPGSMVALYFGDVTSMR